MSFKRGCSSHRSGEYHIYLLSRPRGKYRSSQKTNQQQRPQIRSGFNYSRDTAATILWYRQTTQPESETLLTWCNLSYIHGVEIGRYVIRCKYAISHLICDSCASLLPALSSPQTSHRGIVIVATMKTIVLLLGTIAVASADIYQTLVPTGLPATSTDHWGCATENLTQYFQPPEPTGALNFALWSYRTELRRDSCPGTELFCPYPSHSRCCGFSTYVQKHSCRPTPPMAAKQLHGGMSTAPRLYR